MTTVLNGIVAPDAYSAGATIEGTPIQSMIVNIANQAIYYQLKTGIGGISGQWEASEAQALPSSFPISSDRPDEIVGIRFRAAIPLASLPSGTSQAVVSIRTSP